MPRRRPSDRMTIAVLAATGMLTSLQFTLIVPNLPDIPGLLGIGIDDASWIVTITLLTSAVATPILGRLADTFGRRRMLLIALALLVIGSIIAGVGPWFGTVLVGRALQGMATAIVPVGMSLISDLTSPARAKAGIALMSGTVGVGSALGFPLSGLLSALGGLPLVFWFSAVVGLVFIALIRLLVPESATRSPGRFDLTGALILALGLTAVLLVVSKSLAWSQSAPWLIVACVLVAVASFAVWIPWELRRKHPVVDLRLFMRRRVLQTNIASFFAAFGMFANHLLTMQEARAPVSAGAGLGLPAVTAGLILVPSAVVMVSLTPVAARALNRLGGRTTLAIGSAVIATAFLFRLVFHDGLVPVILAATVVGVGTALAFSAMPSLIIDAVPADARASATSVNSLMRSLSGAAAAAALAYLGVAHAAPASPEYLSETGLVIGFALVALLSTIGTVLALALPRAAGGRSPRWA